MNKEDTILRNTPLKQRIEAMPEDSILFRSDFPEYHAEFVGSVLSELASEGVLTKMGQGIYVKPRNSRFGMVRPSVDKIVHAIATRDNAEVMPSGEAALNMLGISTQVPMKYVYVTSGSERTINLINCQVVLKHCAPRNFCYKTELAALLAQALKSLKRNNVGDDELYAISSLISKVEDKTTLAKDIDMMPAWMRHTVKPLLNA